jgi:hypothetical protein
MGQFPPFPKPPRDPELEVTIAAGQEGDRDAARLGLTGLDARSHSAEFMNRKVAEWKKAQGDAS